MAVPKYDEMMLPLLTLLGKAQGAGPSDYPTGELAVKVADHFKLSEEERNELLPSTASTYLRSRVGWACFHLVRAGLVLSPKRSTLRITPEGLKVLQNPPPKIDRAYLMQFSQFREFMAKHKRSGSAGAKAKEADNQPSEAEDEATPEERLEAAFTELHEKLVSDLLDKLATVDPFRFEQVVLDLLVAMGYGGSRKEAAEVTRKTGDEGIDGVINEDRLGLDVIYVQAKRWKSSVGRPEIQNFVGALAGKKASKGVFITTSAFHENARQYATGLHQKVILIDGQRLAELMIEHGIGVAEEHAYSVRKLDNDYFD